MTKWLNIEGERIVSLTDEELRLLMAKILPASAHAAGCDVSRVTVNTRSKAADGGCDGYTPNPTKSYTWIKPEETCWQFKSGDAGEPAKIVNDLKKQIPQDVLKRGGWFIVVDSGCSNGEMGRAAREESLKEEAKKLGLPTDKIAVYTADNLSAWASEYPAASSFLYDVEVGSFLTTDEWINQLQHQVHFTPAGSISDELKALREDFLNRPFETAEPRIGYVYGQAGAGKTRFVMEAVRESKTKYNTVYLPSATTSQLDTLAGYLLKNQKANLIVVADEAMSDEKVCASARMQVDRFDGRLRVLLIAPRLDGGAPREVIKFKRETDDKQLSEIVTGWFGQMPQEHVTFIVNQSENNVRMARLIGEALERGDIKSTSQVFKHPEIQAILDRILGTADRQALQVVAVAESVGWTGKAAAEGKMIAEKLGLSWGDVQSKVHEAHRVLGIAPLAGSRRYISPAPLGKYLAQNVWVAHTDAMRELIRELPEPGRTQLIERLQDLGGDPTTERVAREEVEQFQMLDDFRNEASARLFRSIARVMPEAALARLKDALQKASPEDIKGFGGSARRELIWELDSLSWPSKNFRNAVWCLALLSAGENEAISNNATGILNSRYQIILGGTSTPYLERLEILDEIWQSDRKELVPVILSALKSAAEDHVTRFDSGYSRHEVLEPEWMPKTNGENFRAVEAAVLTLERYLQDEKVLESEDICVKVVSDYVRLLDVPKLFDPISNIIRRVIELFPRRREEVRLVLKRHIHWTEETSDRRGKPPIPTTLEQQKELHEALRETTFDGRIKEFVGQPSWEADEKRNSEMEKIAEEIYTKPDLLRGDGGAWLTSGEAGDPWAFGKILGKCDEKFGLLAEIWQLTLSGKDDRLLGGYLEALEEGGHTEFVDEWLDSRIEDEEGLDFIFAVSTKLKLTEKGQIRILKMLKEEKATERSVFWLKYGGVMDRAPVEMFVTVLDLLSKKPEWRAIGLDVFSGRLARAKDLKIEDEKLVKIADGLISDTSLIYGRHTSEYDWTVVAKWYLPHDPIKVAQILIDAHLGNDGDDVTWFLRHSQASKIFQEALKAKSQEIWELIAKRLEGDDAFRFTIGFPHGLIEIVPDETILAWAATDPKKRVRHLLRITSIEPEKEDSLGMKLLAKFGKTDGLSSDFVGSYVEGSWSGETSDYFFGLAKRLDEALPLIKNLTIRQWLKDTSSTLKANAQEEREREAERRLLSGF